ncbi:NAD(P)H-dependent oxidoreductase [Xenophilus aerolatus]|nr:NAD(P)H-dependent oxidoreductase [Xenophilus aerolatus]
MNILLVHAHPEARSLNGTLARFMREHLEAAGHTVQVSDLHAMRWKATLDADDFPARDRATPFRPAGDSQQAYASGQQTRDVAAEQAKLLWADTVILQFPIWWFSMPAILKGWVDRVYAYGFAYGVGEHSERRWGDRYGEGTLAGKRAMLVVTAGGWASHYAPRGINGPIDDLLFPIQHGILYYPGFTVLPPFVVYRSDRMDAARLAQVQAELAARLDTLATVAPVPFRPQNAGDYDIPAMTLREPIAPGRTGFGIHQVEGGA